MPKLVVAIVLAVMTVLVAGAAGSLFAAAPAYAHPEPGDVDGDGVFDRFDNCPSIRNADQLNTDGDGRPQGDPAGDACDDDDDADGVPDATDNCRLDANAGQLDANGTADGDGIGDACEGDRDGDGLSDAVDSCREHPNPGQEDTDRDGSGDPCDPDDDDDGVFDERDNCPAVANPDQVDADADGHGHACDPDDAATPPAAIDTTAPRVRIQLAAPPRFAAVGSALAVRLRCSEACAATARLLLGRRTATRLGLRRRRIVAEGSAEVAAAATTYAFLRFERRARRLLWRRAQVRLTLRVVVRDSARNARTVTRRVQLRR